MRRLGVTLLTVFAALAVWLGAPLVVPNAAFAARPAAPALAGGRLVIGRPDGVWVALLDGSQPTRLAENPEGAVTSGVSWAPGGDRVAYTRLTFQPDVGSELHLVDLSGQDHLVLPRDVPSTVFGKTTWTPDGELFLDVTRFAADSAGPHIDRVQQDGSGRQTLVPDGFAPSLSRDGHLLAFLRHGDAGYALWLRQMAGGAETQVVPPGTFVELYSPSLSPDGSTLVFAAPAAQGAAALNAACPTPTPSGWLAPPPALAHGVPKELWRINADGSGLTRLTSLCLDDPVAAWSPDGTWLAAYGGTGLLMLHADGSGQAQQPGLGAYGGVDWAP